MNLEQAVRTGDIASVYEILSTRGSAGINNYSIPLLSRAITDDNLMMVNFLLAFGADPNQGDRYAGMTPLMVAGDKLHMITALLNGGADPNGSDRYGITALMKIVQGEHDGGEDDLNAVRLLLAAGADVNAQADSGYSALMALMKDVTDREDTNVVEMAELLLEKGADPDLQDYRGETALMKLMEQDLEDENVSDLIHLLLEAGADLNTISNNHGLTALDILHQQGGSEDVLRR